MKQNKTQQEPKETSLEKQLLGNKKGRMILEKCGRECAIFHGLPEIAKKIRANATDKNDIDYLIKTYKEKVCNISRLYKKSNIIYLEYDKCVCPVVNGQVKDPFACNCTKGFTKMIFEPLFDKPIEVKLLNSILKGDNICKQAISIL